MSPRLLFFTRRLWIVFMTSSRAGFVSTNWVKTGTAPIDMVLAAHRATQPMWCLSRANG